MCILKGNGRVRLSEGMYRGVIGFKFQKLMLIHWCYNNPHKINRVSWKNRINTPPPYFYALKLFEFRNIYTLTKNNAMLRPIKLIFCFSGTAAFVVRPPLQIFLSKKWCPYFCQIDLASDTTESFFIAAGLTNLKLRIVTNSQNSHK